MTWKTATLILALFVIGLVAGYILIPQNPKQPVIGFGSRKTLMVTVGLN